MKDFFLKVAHLFTEVDHWVMGAIHYLGNYFEGAVIKHAIEAVKSAGLTYADHEFKDAQVRAFAVDSVVKVFPFVSVNRANVLVSHLMDIADSKVSGILEHLAAHFESAAPAPATATDQPPTASGPAGS